MKRFTEDKTLSIFTAFLREFLAELDRAFKVDVKLKDNLSAITTGQERGNMKELARETLENFKRKFSKTDLSSLPAKIETEEAAFKIMKCTDRDVGYPRMIQP
ncbi:hypothetical protein AKJ52_03010 [candidate division MSBL1 archaeon SCGC-AAA382C18]|uniref:Uncharacterized protein n=1 Tax=candidate division MSBL1 archaeon SCGC-AAA382C18 TaxID=1698281 RepID=A0A133VH81_9EURY|nr:hypothetical protein AKJ52_03010 [candidate division MSBL1 archaeon SCGC-AAA382C18]